VGEDVPQKFLEQLEDTLNVIASKKTIIDVEEIQDIIQKELIKRNKYEAAEEFIVYRNKRTEVREQKSSLVKNIRKKLGL
jgi:anaerobic ribonucleoside-triphosphate reductase